jgi:rhodanese-related sulfurtransferase
MTLITRPELELLIGDGAVQIIDALPESYFVERHLPGAINLTEEDVDARASDLFPDKDAPIVTYCSDNTCGNSKAVAARLADHGYSNVRTYEEGINDWVASGNSVATGSH